MGYYDIRFDKEKNRLYLHVEGFFRDSEAREAIAEFEKIVNDLSPGFDTITDISRFKPASPGVARSFRSAGELVKAKGRRRGIRVAGGLVTALMQFKRELNGIFDDESTRYAKTLSEAERMLDEWE